MSTIDKVYEKKIQNLGNWIDKPFLEEVLSHKIKETVRVENYSVTAAVPAGENYLSTLYRTQVSYKAAESSKLELRHLMIKGLPESNVTTEKLHEMKTFHKESFFYTVILPELKKLLVEHFGLENTSIAPDEYFTSREDTLVMEDISQDGYKMKNRHDQLDYDHCVITLKALARLHALTAKLHETDPIKATGSCAAIYSGANRSYMCTFVDEAVKAVTNEMENWCEFEDSKQLAEKIRDTLPFMWEKCVALERGHGSFCVLNHGDMWINNVMFKYNEDGSISSVKMVDFQLSRYTSPALDLHYFLNSSVQTNVLSEHLFDLLATYHEALMNDLNTLGVFIDYSLSHLHDDMREFSPFGVSVIASISAIVLAPAQGAVTNDGVEIIAEGTENHILAHVYKSELYKNYAIRAYRLFDKVGYLEDAVARLNDVVDGTQNKSSEQSDLSEKADTQEFVTNGSVGSTHDERNIFARLKSAVKGACRKCIHL